MKGILTKSWKAVGITLLFSALAFSHYYAYELGVRSEIRKNAGKTATQEREKGKKAVARTEKDVRKILDLEKENAELIKKLEELSDRVLCPMSDDELRILEEIQGRTKPK